MAITRYISEMEPDPFGKSASGQLCFFCGDFVHNPGVVWHGSTGQNIYFHAICILQLCDNLIKDAWQIERMGRATGR
jgi:hypothetical protein